MIFLIAVVWVAYGIVFFGTLAMRKIKHIYVANWFFAAYIITIAVLHIINNLAIPVSLTKSYVIYSGVVDAMVEWWYGHNAVGFFLTAAFLGMMYYFVPKQAGRPIYSYRLSIVHFWALISIYMWAGPHHLHYTSLPDWVQSLGMVFSVILLAPSWGGMINGMMTLSGAWHKLRTDPILKFLIVSLSFYGMSTFEGPMMSIKTVNALSHNTDWTIGHVHSGRLGWVAFMVIGSMYALIPKLWGRKEMWSVRLIDVHFWIATIGVVLYVTAMWIAGVMQGLMWRATNPDGTLTYTFVESLKATYPYYMVRLGGGLAVPDRHVSHALQRDQDRRAGEASRRRIASRGVGLMEEQDMNHEFVEKNAWLMGTLDRRRHQRRRSGGNRTAVLPGLGHLALAGDQALSAARLGGPRRVRARGLLSVPHPDGAAAARRKWSGTATIRSPARRCTTIPFQFGSKRTGPDLARIGGKYSDQWHRIHLNNPARRGAGVEHARVHLARERHPRRQGGRRENARAATHRCALHGPGDRVGRRASDRPQRNGCPGRLLCRC